MQSHLTGLPRAPQLIGLPASTKPGAASSASTAPSLLSGTGVGVFTSTSAAFDGVVSKSYTACATRSSTSPYGNYIGLNHGSPFYLRRVLAWAPNDEAFIGTRVIGNLRVDGSADGSTLVPLLTTTYPAEIAGQVYIEFTSTTAYQYHYLNFGGDGSSNIRVAQIQFYGVA